MSETKNLKNLENILGVKFQNQQLLIEAITHRSYLNEHPEFKLLHNERLEFLGDAVLELIVTGYLYKNYPNPEGDLTNWRASLVNRINLAKIAQLLEIEAFIKMSRGEAKDSNSKARLFILSNALEALIGAIYLDQGLETAEKFIHKNILTELSGIIENRLYVDPKSELQEKTQEKLNITPTYKVLNAAGPDHHKTFEIGVYLNKKLIAKGAGSSKQEAQTVAARNALEKTF